MLPPRNLEESKHLTLGCPNAQLLNIEDYMETASLGVDEDHLSKMFMAGLRTQPDQADTVTSRVCKSPPSS